MKVFLLSLKFCSACGVQRDREHCLENHLPGRAASLAQALGQWVPPPTPEPQLPSECSPSWRSQPRPDGVRPRVGPARAEY